MKKRIALVLAALLVAAPSAGAATIAAKGKAKKFTPKPRVSDYRATIY
jgi:hypothetical protein